MTRTCCLFAAFVLIASPAFSAEFYIDPQNGSPTNDGSEASPWRSLQEVVDAGLIETQTWDALPFTKDSVLVPKNENGPIKSGDTIWLKSGDYGDVMIRRQYNEDTITIAAAEGHTPRFRSLTIQSGSHWAVKGLHVCPEFGEGPKPYTMINFQSHGFGGPVRDMSVEDCVLQSTPDSSGWSAEDWNQRACNGIGVGGTRIVIRNNKMTNVDFGISVDASHSLIEHNVVENFSGDGLRGLGDHSVFQYNLVKNCYNVDANHDDGFQSWSVGPDGVGSGQVVGIVLRGNTIINREDPNQPHQGALQGIGCFDGMFVDWIVENNVVVVDHYHGITLMGATGCRFANNTVIDPNDVRPGPSALRVSNHKRGTPSSGCIVRNNLASAINVQGENMTIDHNLNVEDPASFFTDFETLDLHLRVGSPAIDAGSSELSPEIDIEGTARPQGDAIDIGAYEHFQE